MTRQMVNFSAVLSKLLTRVAEGQIARNHLRTSIVFTKPNKMARILQNLPVCDLATI